MLSDSGIKITELYAGDFKTKFSPFKPLSEDAVDAMQERLTAVHRQFVQAVADGRGTRATAGIRAAGFGGGRMFTANEAFGHGLADKVQDPREFYREIQTGRTETGTGLVSSTRRARLELERNRL
jgi:capsid assembly protease